MTAEEVAGSRIDEAPGVPAERLPRYERIVVALDGSKLAEQVLAAIEPLARVFGSKVICVCAVEPVDGLLMGEWSLGAGLAGGTPIEPLIETREEIRRDDASYLAQIRENLTAKGLRVECEEPEGRAADAIVAIAHKHHADLIAMTTHGRSGLGRTLLGSVTDQVLHTAPCPVLLVRTRRTIGEG